MTMKPGIPDEINKTPESDSAENNSHLVTPHTAKKRTNMKLNLQLFLQKKEFIFFLMIQDIVLFLRSRGLNQRLALAQTKKRSNQHLLQHYGLFKTIPLASRHAAANDATIGAHITKP